MDHCQLHTGDMENGYGSRLEHTIFKWRSVCGAGRRLSNVLTCSSVQVIWALFICLWGLATSALIQTTLSPLPKQIHKAANQIFKCLSRYKKQINDSKLLHSSWVDVIECLRDEIVLSWLFLPPRCCHLCPSTCFCICAEKQIGNCRK